MAWMVANGSLEIKVAMPIENDKPVPRAIFHHKTGIFTDAFGDKISFSGSVNESEQGWTLNNESFHVFCSWKEDKDHLDDDVALFEKHWNNYSKKARVYEFPEALKRRIISFAPRVPPSIEQEEKIEPVAPAEFREAIIRDFILGARYLVQGEYLADAFLNFELLPHQRAVADAASKSFPTRFLLADEVGLGKTIEAGTILSRLIVSGKIRRCLILVPAAIAGQWQDQMHNKFGLDFYRYDRGQLILPDGRARQVGEGNPYEAADLIIASTSLAARKGRNEELLSAKDWDMVVLDEAHHARRKHGLYFGVQDRGDEPNQLLRLMRALNDESKTRDLLLLTATPMQLRLEELYDLLSILGVKGLWDDEDSFAKYFEMEQGARFFDQELPLYDLYGMAREYLDEACDPVFEGQMRREFGPASWDSVKRVFLSNHPLEEARRLSDKERTALAACFKRFTPLSQLMFRNTRRLLREYKKRGLSGEDFPQRQVTDIFIEFSVDEERKLYNQLEEYIGNYYRLAEEKHALILKIILQVMRRRLTSSPRAIRQTLDRRLRTIDESIEAVLTEDDEDDVLFNVETDENRRIDPKLVDERRFLEQFLAELRETNVDSKLDHFMKDVEDLLGDHRAVLVFTQYTDTMDYIRDRLSSIYGPLVACISGRGGEILDPVTRSWKRAKTSEVQQSLGGSVRILIGTEALGEGLDLQLADAVVNYDMPWNPMKVEQRIGRIDRIEQKSPTIAVYNYFYKDTIEAKIYEVLNQRHKLFNDVVGEAPEILAEIEEIIEEGIAVPKDGLDNWVQERTKEILDRYEEYKADHLLRDEMARKEEPSTAHEHPPYTREEFDAALSDFGFAELNGHAPPSLPALTFDHGASKEAGTRVVRLSKEAPWPRVAYFCRLEGESSVSEIKTLKGLREEMKDNRLAEISEADLRITEQLFARNVEEEMKEFKETLKHRREFQLERLRKKAELVLDKIVAVRTLVGVKLEEKWTGDVEGDNQWMARKVLKSLIDGKQYDVDWLAKLANISVDRYNLSRYVLKQYEGKKQDELNGHLAALVREVTNIETAYRGIPASDSLQMGDSSVHVAKFST